MAAAEEETTDARYARGASACKSAWVARLLCHVRGGPMDEVEDLDMALCDELLAVQAMIAAGRPMEDAGQMPTADSTGESERQFLERQLDELCAAVGARQPHITSPSHHNVQVGSSPMLSIT